MPSRGREFPDVVHRLVRTHSESGPRGLYLGRDRGSLIQGLPEEEAKELFARLLPHMIQPQFVHTHHWRPGDVLMEATTAAA